MSHVNEDGRLVNDRGMATDESLDTRPVTRTLKQEPDVSEIRARLIAEGVPESILDDVIAHDGKVWDTAQMQEDFTAVGFAAPFVVVTRKSDGVTGTLMFTNNPRRYYAFQEDK